MTFEKVAFYILFVCFVLAMGMGAYMTVAFLYAIFQAFPLPI